MYTQSYAERLRAAMYAKGPNNLRGGMDIRTLSRLASRQGRTWSYEHIRKIVRGQPVQSRECNDDLCAVLKLPVDEMWEVAEREKMQDKLRVGKAMAPEDHRFARIWPTLSEAGRQRVLAYTIAVQAQEQLERDTIII